ncbi:MAG: alanyl-tRNA editing protein [archaeon]
MEEALYLKDSYLKEFEAEVKEVKDQKFVVLDKTAFYPASGGQPHDEGLMIRESDGKEFKVVYVGKFSGQISHEVEPEGLQPGDRVKCKIDWERRYKLMKMHTSAHILSGVIENETGALISGNQLNLDKSRLDFSLEKYDWERIPFWFAESNKIVDQDLSIEISFMSRTEAEKDPSLFKLVAGFPHKIDTIRIVDIVGLVKEADGGTHVKSTKEVGHLKFIEAKNKGKSNRRIYYELE